MGLVDGFCILAIRTKSYRPSVELAITPRCLFLLELGMLATAIHIVTAWLGDPSMLAKRCRLSVDSLHNPASAAQCLHIPKPVHEVKNCRAPMHSFAALLVSNRCIIGQS